MEKLENHKGSMKYCQQTYVDEICQSKTVTEEMARKIQAILKDFADVFANMKHWVLKTKKFGLLYNTITSALARFKNYPMIECKPLDKMGKCTCPIYQ